MARVGNKAKSQMLKDLHLPDLLIPEEKQDTLWTASKGEPPDVTLGDPPSSLCTELVLSCLHACWPPPPPRPLGDLTG